MSEPLEQPTVLVTGATGFIGKRLVPALVDRGLKVRAMTRRPESYDGPGQAVGGDVEDRASLSDALEGADVAVYLVHSLDDPDFERKDAEAARTFGRAAAAAGVQQIVYMGGLGSDDEKLSPHLRSRREVEGLLGEAGVPVTVLRAAIVVGAGGISWELTRQLVKNLPAKSAFRILFIRLSMDGAAGIRFILTGKPMHTWAIFKSHMAFYWFLSRYMRKRQDAQSSHYYLVNNIVTQYFQKKRRFFTDLHKSE